MTRATDVLATCRRVVVVGASPDQARYGHEVLEAFHAAGHDVVAVNPKYDRIDERPCYASLRTVPGRADVAVLVLSPDNAQRLLPDVHAAGIATVWLPPGTASEATVQAARALGLAVIDDVCPVATLRRGKRPLTTARPSSS
jgi:predicted CoA-binding protein